MSVFRFKEFIINQEHSAMKVGTDAMVLGAIVSTEGCKRALDIGAGTGVLSLMIAQKDPEILIDAVELDPQSAKECALNFNCSSWSDRLIVHQVDIGEYKATASYDLIICNPPFFRSRNENSEERAARTRHERFMPLEVIHTSVTTLLSDHGHFYVIAPKEDEVVWLRQFGQNLHLRKVIDIVGKAGGKIKRVILKFSREAGPTAQATLCIRTDSGTYTEAYKQLTADFHATRL